MEGFEGGDVLGWGRDGLSDDDALMVFGLAGKYVRVNDSGSSRWRK